jgi:hypothetical protein
MNYTLRDVLRKYTGYDLECEISKVEGIGDGFYNIELFHVNSTKKSISSFSTIPIPKGSIYFSGIVMIKNGKIFVHAQYVGRIPLNNIEKKLLNYIDVFIR